jgi:hypothetical protein
MVIGDHVRPDSGVFNILAAGIDRIYTELPGMASFGLAARIAFTSEEARRPHIAEIRIASPDGAVMLQLRGQMTIGVLPSDLPGDWPPQGGIGVNVSVPIQKYGVHRLALLVDDLELKVIRILVEPPQEA